MNLAVALALAATRDDKSGSINCLGLGITRLWPKGLPATFNGAIVLIADFESSDHELEREFVLTLSLPSGGEPVRIGEGRIGVRATPDQVVLSAPIALKLQEMGRYVVQVEFPNDNLRGELHLVAAPESEKPNP